MMQRSETAQHLPSTGNPSLQFGPDRWTRAQWMVPDAFGHPAKLHLHLLGWIVEQYTQPGDWIGDPMAGIGSTLLAATTGRHVWAMDCEPHWVDLMEANAAKITACIAAQADLYQIGHMYIQRGDARQPWGITVDHIICSPPYGCRISPNRATRAHALRNRQERLQDLAHDPRWESLLVSESQKGALGADYFWYGDHTEQIGAWQGSRYWAAMHQVYTQAYTALHPGGRLILVLKDFIQAGQRVPVVDQTIECGTTLGFRLMDRRQRILQHFALWTRRRKEQGQPVVEEEDIIVFQR